MSQAVPPAAAAARADAPARAQAAAFQAIAAIATLGLWLVTRPYRGVRHDGILYLGQVLDRLMPQRFHDDLFFAFGSQDRYSLFSPLVAPLIARFGVGTTETVLLALCHLAFMAGCWLLTASWPSRTLRWAALMCVAVLPHTYGGLGAFGFSEPFLTARSIAEPFALLALWQLLAGRVVPGLLLAAVGVAFHPLILLPVLVIGWIHLLLGDRRWAWAGLLALVPAVLGAAGIAPFDALWRTFDAEWWQALKDGNANAFVTSNTVLDWVPLGFDVVVALTFLGLAPPPPIARLVKATLAATVLLSVLWGVGADVFHDVLVTQLQLWRVYWPLHLLALLAMPWVLVAFAARGPVGRWCAAALLLAGIAAMSNWATGWLCLAWAVAALAADRWQAKVSRTVLLLAAAGSLAGILAITWRVGRVTMQAVSSSPDRFAGAGPLLVALGLPAVGLTLGFAILRASQGSRAARGAAAFVAVVLSIYGATQWDQRSAWQRRLEAGLEAGPVFDAAIPAGATLWWTGVDLLEPWMLGQRGLYYNPAQSAGLLFNRGTALAFAQRGAPFKDMQLQHELCVTVDVLTNAPGTGGGGSCVPTLPILSEVCHASPHPDYLVLDGTLALPPVAEWRYRSPDGRESHQLDVYRCADIH